MVYEVREWSAGHACLYTDDHRLKDLAIVSGDLRVVARYYRSDRARDPFAWDIVGERANVARIARQFSR